MPCVLIDQNVLLFGMLQSYPKRYKKTNTHKRYQLADRWVREQIEFYRTPINGVLPSPWYSGMEDLWCQMYSSAEEMIPNWRLRNQRRKAELEAIRCGLLPLEEGMCPLHRQFEGCKPYGTQWNCPQQINGCNLLHQWCVPKGNGGWLHDFPGDGRGEKYAFTRMYLEDHQLGG